MIGVAITSLATAFMVHAQGGPNWAALGFGIVVAYIVADGLE
jgi:hypothetical protein